MIIGNLQSPQPATSKTGMYIGIAVGAIAFSIVIAVGAYLLYRRYHSKAMRSKIYCTSVI